MTTPAMTFINLPLTDVKVPTAFHEALGFVYPRTISDPDGHRRELFFMDMTQAPQG